MFGRFDSFPRGEDSMHNPMSRRGDATSIWSEPSHSEAMHPAIGSEPPKQPKRMEAHSERARTSSGILFQGPQILRNSQNT